MDDAKLLVINLAASLENEGVVEKDWSETLCTAPGVIVIMGESMVLASVPSAAQVRFKKEHIMYAMR